MKYIVLDVGTSKISILELDTKLKGFEILRYEETALPLSLTPHSPEEHVRAIKNLTETFSFKNAKLITHLTADSVATKYVTLPFKDRRKINQTYLFELEEHSPFPIDKVVIDYEIIKQVGKQSTILATIAPHYKIASFLKILEAAGLDPDVISAPQVALASLTQYMEGATD